MQIDESLDSISNKAHWNDHLLFWQGCYVNKVKIDYFYFRAVIFSFRYHNREGNLRGEEELISVTVAETQL